MFAGVGPYRATGPVPLRVLAELERHLLVTVDSFPDRHAFLLAQAVNHLSGRLAAASVSPGALSVPEHPGAVAYRSGRLLPAASEEKNEQEQ
jgi:hypothetical protein